MYLLGKYIWNAQNIFFSYLKPQPVAFLLGQALN